MPMTTPGTDAGTGSGSPPVKPSARQTVSYLFARLSASAATALSAFFVALLPAGPFSQLVTVVFVVLTPALAISGLLPRLDWAAVALVAGAGAVALNAVVAQAMLAANRWSPDAAVVIIGLTTSLLWLLPSVSPENDVSRRKGNND
jgi:hypothetical protein